MSNPLHPMLALLALAVPLFWFAGRELILRAGGAYRALRVCVPGVCLSLWLLAVHLPGKIAGSFTAGFVIGTLTLAAAGVAVVVYRRRRGLALPTLEPSRDWIWVAIASAVCVAYLAPAAFTSGMHDEVTSPIAHQPLIAQIQNDAYPPRHLIFPDWENRYHYGFAVITTMLTALTRLDIPVAMDCVTLAAWGYAFWLLWTLGEQLFANGAGKWTALLVLFLGGPVYLCNYQTHWATRATTLCIVEDWLASPPMASYFFQHPFSVGIPLALCVLIVAFDNETRAPWRYVVLATLLIALSLCQFVLFLTITGTVALREVLKLREELGLAKSIGQVAALIGVVLAGAYSLGGFFASVPAGARSTVVVRLGLTYTWAGSAEWLLVSYGVLLPAGLYGIWKMQRERLAIFTLFAGSFLCMFFFNVRNLWDIAKFGLVAAIALSIGAAALVSELMRSKRHVARAGGLFLVVACTLASAAHSAAFIDKLVFSREHYLEVPQHTFPEDPAGEIIRWVRPRVKTGEVIFVSDFDNATAYASWTGHAVGGPWIGWHPPTRWTFRRISKKRMKLFKEMPPEAERYLELGFRWFLIGPKDQRLRLTAKGWIDAGRAVKHIRIGDVEIVELR